MSKANSKSTFRSRTSNFRLCSDRREVGKPDSGLGSQGGVLSPLSHLDVHLASTSVLPAYAPLLSSSASSFLLQVSAPELSNSVIPALVDSAANPCFISPDLLCSHTHLLSELPTPLDLKLFNGSLANQIRHFVIIPIVF